MRVRSLQDTKPDLLRCDSNRHAFALNGSWNHGIDQGSHIPVVSAAGFGGKRRSRGTALRVGLHLGELGVCYLRYPLFGL
jgi:hypothetical protein